MTSPLRLAGLLLALAGPATAATYSTLPTTELVDGFGANVPDTVPYVGQVFTAPGGSLQSWTVRLEASGTGNFRFLIQSWDATNQVPTGSALFTSSDIAGVTGGETSYQISGLNLALASGSSFIAYITTVGAASPLGMGKIAVSDTASALGGQAYYWDGDNLTWLTLVSYQLSFTAVFSDQATPVPAPGGLGLFGLALVGVAAARSRPRGCHRRSRTH